jgi:hypothetical protein
MQTVSEQQSVALRLTDWLETLDRTYASPVVVKIGRSTYPGAFYTQVRDTPDYCNAYRSGERSYGHSMLYVIGELPYSYRRSSKAFYRVPGARFPWYVAGWYDRSEPNKWHPFGRMFQLALDKTDSIIGINGESRFEFPIHLIG